MKKRLLTLLLAVSVLTGLLAGCGDSGKGKETQGINAPETQEQEETSSPVTETAAEETLPRKLTVGIKSDPLVTDYVDNHMTRLLEETLDCELEIVLLPSDSDDFNTKLGLMVNSPEQLPDVIFASLSLATVYEYGSKGAFVDLSSYVNEEGMPNFFKNVPEEDREIMINGMTSADGGVYCMTKYEPGIWNMSPYRLWMNMTWLDELGLSVPETTDDLYNVLKAFKTEDPNGNGISDEMAGYGRYGSTSGANLVAALMNSFIYYDPNKLITLDETGEKAIAPFTMDAYKEGLTYLNKLYAEGLIEPAMFTDDNDQVKANCNNEVNIIGLIASNSHSIWVDAVNNPNFLDMRLIAPLEGSDGVAYTVCSQPTATPMFYVTSQCENVDLAVELGDIFFDETVSISSRYGVEGEDWTNDPEIMAKYTQVYIETGFKDAPDAVLYNNIWPNQTNHYWKAVNPGYRMQPVTPSATEEYLKESFSLNATSQSTVDNLNWYYKQWPEYLMPVLKYSVEEQDIYNEVYTLIRDYVRQSMAEFVTGVKDIEKEWNSYLNELDEMGLEELLKISQSAYDRTK